MLLLHYYSVFQIINSLPHSQGMFFSDGFFFPVSPELPFDRWFQRFFMVILALAGWRLLAGLMFNGIDQRKE